MVFAGTSPRAICFSASSIIVIADEFILGRALG